MHDRAGCLSCFSPGDWRTPFLVDRLEYTAHLSLARSRRWDRSRRHIDLVDNPGARTGKPIRSRKRTGGGDGGRCGH